MERLSFSPHAPAASRGPSWKTDAKLGSCSQSRLAGHILSARDLRTPVAGAQLMLGFREVSCHIDGLYETSLDALPVQVELLITARGYHPHQELLDWTVVASGGLILRDFYLTPLDMPKPAPRHPAAASTTPTPGNREDLSEGVLDDIDLNLEECDLAPEDAEDEEMIAWSSVEDNGSAVWEQLDEVFDEFHDEVEISLDPSLWPTLKPARGR